MRQPTLCFVLALLLTVGVAAKSAAAQGSFVPPRVVTASDLAYPRDSVISGLVILSVGLDAAGQIRAVETLRDIPTATGPALVSAKAWAFSPAKRSGQAVDSSIALNVLFNPQNAALRRVSLQGANLRAGVRNEQGYVPPEVRSAFYAENLATTVDNGAVVLDVSVSRSGRVTNASAVYTMTTLTNAALSAVRRWRFTPGRLQGAAIESTAVVVFVFSPPSVAVPPGSSPAPVR